ncbi:LacI family DNA-binding transcriptional regulator [Populibacterium corticicola]|uniref:LacI family DNA-binding transcriptional regulator n=1 Tax=Populibacterium corticicola TaxID=1812826 RepID=A0ABW5XDS8_9MICO
MATPPKHTTIIDVARDAGVSRQTVTRALNDMADVSEATRARVLESARRLRYRPNRAAQALVRGGGVAVGFLVDNFKNPYYAELASALTRAAAEHGWNVILADLADDEVRSRAQVQALLPRIDALVLTGCRGGTVGMIPIDDLRGGLLGIPTVMIDGDDATAVDAVVEVDHITGVRDAIAHLVSRGRRHIGMITSTQFPGSLRHDTFRTRLDELGLHRDARSEAAATETYRGGEGAAGRLLAGYPDLDAILVYNDAMALGVIKELSRQGVAVPGQVAVIGIDGLEIGELITPELTTLNVDKEELARYAIDAIQATMSFGVDSARGTVRNVPLVLRVRESA